MTGAIRGGVGVVQRLEELLPHLGLDAEQLLVHTAEPPAHLNESHLQSWSYTPEFTPLVQQLLQLRRPGRCLSVALGVSSDATATGPYTAVQLAIGFSQHGLSTVVVDADFARPGLSGLLADPHQEGLVDMARFGRSCRALLVQPVPDGPRLLGTGSFPLQAPSPFAGDAWLGIVHRIALHTEVALFVAPLDVEEDLNPLLRHVEQVLYLPGAKSWECTEAEVERLRRSAARVASVVLCSPGPAAPAPGFESLGETHVSAMPPTFPEFASELDAQPSPAFALDRGATSAHDSLAPMREEPEQAENQVAEAPRPLSFPQPPAWDDVPPLRGEVTRSAEEENQLRRQLRLGDTEFSYSEGGRYSRLPLYLFFALVLGIGGFLGWALWSQRDINRRAADIRASVPPESGEESKGAPSQQPSGSGAGVDDPAASSPSTGSNPVADASKPLEATSGAANPPADPGLGTAVGAPGEAEPATKLPPNPPATIPKPAETSPTPTQVAPKPPVDVVPNSAEPPPATSTPAGGETAFTVHVASYGKLENAHQHIASLRKHGFEARAVRTDLGSKGIFFRVYVGNYASKAAAAEAREAILKLPESAFAQVRRVTEP